MGSRLRKNIGRMRPYKNLQMQQVSIDPSPTTSITAAGGITIHNKVMRVQGSGGAVTITALPNINANFTVDGFELILQGDSDTNTLTLQDESQLTGSKLKLQDTLNQTIGKGDILKLMYDAGDGYWYQSSPTVNN